jgi:hypothetical protein
MSYPIAMGAIYLPIAGLTFLVPLDWQYEQ